MVRVAPGATRVTAESLLSDASSSEPTREVRPPRIHHPPAAEGQGSAHPTTPIRRPVTAPVSPVSHRARTAGRRSSTQPSITQRPRTTEERVRSVISAVEAMAIPRRNVEQIIDATMTIAIREIPCESAQFLLPDQAHGCMRVVAARGKYAAEVVLTRLTVDSSIEEVQGDPVESVCVGGVDGVFVYTTRGGKVVEVPVDSALALPLFANDRVMGAVLLLNSPSTDGFDDAEHTAGDVLADKVAEGLARKL